MAAPRSHGAHHLAGDQMRRLGAGDQHRAHDQIGGCDLLLDVGAVRHHRGDVAAQDVVQVAQARRIAVDDADVRADAGGDLAGVRPGDAGAEDDHLRRSHPGGAAQQNACAAVRRLQAPAADLNRQPAGHLAHRREQRQRAVVELDGLVADGTDLLGAQRSRQLLAGGEVQVGEDDAGPRAGSDTRRAAAP